METIFPTDKGYAGLFLVGFRKDAGHITQRTGTVVLKRTYAINPAAGALAPIEALPIFMQDQPDNLVINSDFETGIVDANGKPLDWQPDGVTLARIADPDDKDNYVLQVRGETNGRIIQTLTFDKPLGGRQFTFSFQALADA